MTRIVTVALPFSHPPRASHPPTPNDRRRYPKWPDGHRSRCYLLLELGAGLAGRRQKRRHVCVQRQPVEARLNGIGCRGSVLDGWDVSAYLRGPASVAVSSRLHPYYIYIFYISIAAAAWAVARVISIRQDGFTGLRSPDEQYAYDCTTTLPIEIEERRMLRRLSRLHVIPMSHYIYTHIYVCVCACVCACLIFSLSICSILCHALKDDCHGWPLVPRFVRAARAQGSSRSRSCGSDPRGHIPRGGLPARTA